MASGAFDDDLAAFWAGLVDHTLSFGHAQNRLAGVAFEITMRFSVSAFVFLQSEKASDSLFDPQIDGVFLLPFCDLARKAPRVRPDQQRQCGKIQKPQMRKTGKQHQNE